MYQQVFKDITTAKDGESFDITRVIMVVNALLLIPILLIGIGFYLYGYIVTKAFDIQGFFIAIMTFEGGVASLLAGGGASLLMKKSTEPDGQTRESIDISHKGGPDSKNQPDC